MKKIFPLVMLCFVLSMCKEPEKTVGTDSSLSANIENYKTYDWVKNIDQIPSDKVFIGPNGILVFNNESARSKIKDAIQYELSAKGYKMDNINPDFYVNFTVLEQPADLTTFNGFQTVDNGLDSVRTPENVQKTHVDAGTVLIDFIDAKTSKQVWQGFASGILKPDMINDQSKVRAAISSIFEKYKYKAATASR